jgi:hypothetical protein
MSCGALLKRLFLVPLLLAGVVDTALAVVEAPRYLADPARKQIEQPDALIQRYLVAVDRGELEVYGQRLKRSMLVPTRIEYVYDLSSRTTAIKIYSTLKEPLPVPGQRTGSIEAVSALMTDGRIIGIESHIWMK